MTILSRIVVNLGISAKRTSDPWFVNIPYFALRCALLGVKPADSKLRARITVINISRPASNK